MNGTRWLGRWMPKSCSFFWRISSGAGLARGFGTATGAGIRMPQKSTLAWRCPAVRFLQFSDFGVEFPSMYPTSETFGRGSEDSSVA